MANQKVRWHLGQGDYLLFRIVTVLVALGGTWFTLGVYLLSWASGDPLKWSAWVDGDQPVSGLTLPAGTGVVHDGRVMWIQENAPVQHWLWMAIPVVATTVLLLVGCGAAWKLINLASAGDPFGGQSVVLVRVLAVIVVAYAVLVPLLAMVATMMVGPDDFLVVFQPSDLWVILVGFGLVLIAEIWRVGATLRDDVEGLV